eukprot:TRINITY_DN71_c0_g1_i2.p2 TRINITY_DN71_c0_g1~~TRINITY_DN71_c0_g1_i2.p2  ORF type:complete len:161 (+),score=11.78 TRINITY_DN71_c0_g1_i2:487-969(+)
MRAGVCRAAWGYSHVWAWTGFSLLLLCACNIVVLGVVANVVRRAVLPRYSFVPPQLKLVLAISCLSMICYGFRGAAMLNDGLGLSRYPGTWLHGTEIQGFYVLYFATIFVPMWLLLWAFRVGAWARHGQTGRLRIEFARDSYDGEETSYRSINALTDAVI